MQEMFTKQIPRHLVHNNKLSQLLHSHMEIEMPVERSYVKFMHDCIKLHLKSPPYKKRALSSQQEKNSTLCLTQVCPITKFSFYFVLSHGENFNYGCRLICNQRTPSVMNDHSIAVQKVKTLLYKTEQDPLWKINSCPYITSPSPH